MEICRGCKKSIAKNDKFLKVPKGYWAGTYHHFDCFEKARKKMLTIMIITVALIIALIIVSTVVLLVVLL